MKETANVYAYPFRLLERKAGENVLAGPHTRLLKPGIVMEGGGVTRVPPGTAIEPFLSVVPNPPSRFEAVLQGQRIRLHWEPPRSLMNRAPIPEDTVIRYQVDRDGVVVAKRVEPTYQETLVGQAAHRYYVTASIEDSDGNLVESKRSELIEVATSVPAPKKPHDAFEVPSTAAEAVKAGLPQVAMADSGGVLFAHLGFVARGLGPGFGDEIRYLRSQQGGRPGSWSSPLSIPTGGEAVPSRGAGAAADVGVAVEVSELRISSLGSDVVLAWIEKLKVSGSGPLSRLLVLESHDGGATWPDTPRVVRSNTQWKRGLGLAHDLLGNVHVVWGEAGKIFYLKNFEGSPNNVFDRSMRKTVEELVKYKAQYPKRRGACECTDCWCEESYVLREEKTWTEEHSVYEPSLYVNQDGIHIVARGNLMWDNVPVLNPLWVSAYDDALYRTEVVHGQKPRKFVVGWRDTWKRAPEPGDEALLLHLGAQYQYLYEGRWHTEDNIVIAQRPLSDGAWSEDSVKWQAGAWSDGVFLNWRMTTIDVLDQDGLDERPSHPQLSDGPGGVLYALYERGPSADPNVAGENSIVLSRSHDGGRSWSPPAEVATGYMPRIAATSGGLAVLAYVPGEEAQGPQKTPIGKIQVSRSRDGTRFESQTINVAWNEGLRSEELRGAQKIHGKTHGPGADTLHGVPVLVAHQDLWMATWVEAPRKEGGRERVTVSRATGLLPAAVQTRVALVSQGAAGPNKPQVVQLQVENQYHMAVSPDLGPVGVAAEATWTGAHGAEATPDTLLGPSATYWWSTDGAFAHAARLVESEWHAGAEISLAAGGSGNIEGNYARALVLRDARYNPSNGAQREFVPDASNQDSEKLADFERVWVYTQGIALAQAARRGEKHAGELATWLCQHAVRDPEDNRVILGWHFSHNTAGDNWKDFRLVTGASAWAIHGLGVFLSAEGVSGSGDAERSFYLECYQAALRGLLRTQTDSGLFTAGFTAEALEGAENGVDYYKVLDSLGYDDETPRAPSTHVVTEHNIDALSVLNHALEHVARLGLAEEELRDARGALRQAIFQHLWDPEKGRIITGGFFDNAGGFVASRFSAVDNCSWLALSVDFGTLSEAEITKVAACLRYTIDAFVKDLPFSNDPQDRSYRGAHYFPADFRDPYIDLSPEAQSKQPRSYHLEATAGVILGLWRFTERVDHEDSAYFRRTGDDLWYWMQRFVHDRLSVFKPTHSEFVYSTRVKYCCHLVYRRARSGSEVSATGRSTARHLCPCLPQAGKQRPDACFT